MGVETIYRLNCDSCNHQEESSDTRCASIKKYDADFAPLSAKPAKPYWSGWLCQKCADGIKVKMRGIFGELSGEHRP